MTDALRFLPLQLQSALKKLDYGRLYEIRVRADKPVRVCYGGRFYTLSPDGVADLSKNGNQLREGGGEICLTAAQINEIIMRAAEFSIYAFNGQIANGYITISGGIRIGVAGEIVYDGDKIKTQKYFGSLVIRIPHEILGSGDRAVSALRASVNKNLLLISPPGCGKTTILRDITRQISNAGHNVLLVDERSEIAACRCGIAALDVGQNTDVINNASKKYAFSLGIRSLRPDYIVTDELMGTADIEAVFRASLSGVNVIASLHASGITDIKNRAELASVFDNQIFGRYIFLSQKSGAGTYEKILDASLNPA